MWWEVRLMMEGEMSQTADVLVRTVDLRVDYGETVAVNGLNLEIEGGEVFGLVGPNGAGKTSSFRVLATLMEPTYGDVWLCGHDASEHPDRARACLGYMPDLAPVASDLRVWEFLDLFAASHGLGAGERRNRIAECLALVQLEGKRSAACKHLSRGMKQRLVLAKTLLHRPRVLLLDEPASGMDPVSRAALKDVLRALAREGAAVVVSSHILTELADMCTSVGIMAQGRLVDSGRVSGVVERLGRTERLIVIRILGRAADLGWAADLLREAKGVSELCVEGDAIRLLFAGSTEAQAELLGGLVKAGCRVRSFEERASTIEEVMLRVAAGQPPGRD
ncbi:MAG TPA: ABC transporter ATP-binding protein [Verrucomicrobiales bacterium]|nr:ABC transporter ATP-binding protein [Verrucomicrobiales bacterium]